MLLGDSAYPLLSWLVKPFFDTADRDKQMFHSRLSSTRIEVERAFGLLKGRFRILNKQQDTQVKNICNVVAACCILHNYCLLHDDDPEDDWMTDDGNGSDDGMILPTPTDQKQEALLEVHCYNTLLTITRHLIATTSSTKVLIKQ